MVAWRPSINNGLVSQRLAELPAGRWISTRLYGDDDLAELTVRFEVAVRLNHFIEHKCLVNHRLQRARCETSEDEVNCSLLTDWVATCVPDRVTNNGRQLNQQIQVGQLRWLPAQRAVHEQNTARRHGFDH